VARSVDWDAIEPQWRAGIKTKLQMSEEFGVSRAAMDKHFAKLGIDRDLTEKIRAKAEALVTQAQVTREVTAESVATERDIVDANATMQADAVLGQRKDISRSRGVVKKLFAELETQLDCAEDFAKLGDLMASPDDNGTDKLNELYRKVMSLPSRVDSAKKLADALRVLIELERKVLRIKDDTGLEDAAKKFGDGVAMSAMEAYSRMCNDPSA
jgi:hypothetical protein